MYQSQAEYTTVAFQSATNVKVIGSTTAGADEMYLRTQRVGVKIDQVLRPTIKATLEGRDELLEAAKKMILE